ANALHAGDARTVRAAEDASVRFDAVADDPTSAVAAHGRERVDRALEAVEDVRASARHDLEGLVVLVVAHLAFGHQPTLAAARHADQSRADGTPIANAARPRSVRRPSGPIRPRGHPGKPRGAARRYRARGTLAIPPAREERKRG